MPVMKIMPLNWFVYSPNREGCKRESVYCNVGMLHYLCFMEGIYFQERGLELMGRLGLSKSEFACRMGIQRQNVNVLFRTNNIEIIARAADVLEVPFDGGREKAG